MGERGRLSIKHHTQKTKTDTSQTDKDKKERTREEEIVFTIVSYPTVAEETETKSPMIRPHTPLKSDPNQPISLVFPKPTVLILDQFIYLPKPNKRTRHELPNEEEDRKSQLSPSENINILVGCRSRVAGRCRRVWKK